MRRDHSRLALAAISLLCAVLLAACGSSTPLLRGGERHTCYSYDRQQHYTTIYGDSLLQQLDRSNPRPAQPGLPATPPSPPFDVNGVATGLSNGTTTITASLGAFSGSAALTVARTLVSIAIAPAAPQTIALGLTTNYTATGTFLNADGTTSTSDITTVATWNSSNAAAATIDNTGLVTHGCNGNDEYFRQFGQHNQPQWRAYGWPSRHERPASDSGQPNACHWQHCCPWSRWNSIRMAQPTHSPDR